MAQVTEKEIERINNLFLIYHNYAQVAREVGRTPTTVKKYVKTNWVSTQTKNIKKFDNSKFKEEFDAAPLSHIKKIGELCILSPEEEDEIEELWEELEA